MHKWGGGGGAQPPVCKFSARMANGGDSKRLTLCMASFKNDPEAVKQACTRLKTARRGRGVGPFANTMLHWLASKTPICCQAGLRKRGLAGRSSPPHLQTHSSHGEWRGLKTQISLRQHCRTTTVIVILIFMYIFSAIFSMCTQACMYACLYAQWM